MRRPIACGFLAHSIRKEPPLNCLILLKVPAIAWNPFWIGKCERLLSGRPSLDDSTTRNLAHFVLVFVKHSLSESVSVSWWLFECVCAIQCILMISYALFPPAAESNRGMHTSGAPASVRQDSKYIILSNILR